MPRNWQWGKHRKSGYRSGFEEKTAASLEARGVKFKYESVRIIYQRPVRKGKCAACGASGKSVYQQSTYTPDFELPESRVLIECKGRLTARDRTKLLLVRDALSAERRLLESPDVDYKLVLMFASDNKLQKNGTKRYSDWATEHGFDFSINTIPRRWLNVRKGAGQQSEDGGGDEKAASRRSSTLRNSRNGERIRRRG